MFGGRCDLKASQDALVTLRAECRSNPSPHHRWSPLSAAEARRAGSCWLLIVTVTNPHSLCGLKLYTLIPLWASQVAQWWVLSLGQEDPLEEGMATNSGILV